MDILLKIGFFGAILLALFLLFMFVVVANDTVSDFFFKHEKKFNAIVALLLTIYGLPLLIWSFITLLIL